MSLVGGDGEEDATRVEHTVLEESGFRLNTMISTNRMRFLILD